MKLHRFELGRIVITPNASAALESIGVLSKVLLHSHVAWHCGGLPLEHRPEGTLKVEHEGLMSVYKLPNDITVWVITEKDHTATTILLPEDY